MTNLPVIVGFGGYNAAGRSSFHHAYRRTIIDSLDKEKQVSTLISLAALMGLVNYQDGHYVDADGNKVSAEQAAEKYHQHIIDNTLIRRISKTNFDVEHVLTHKTVRLNNPQNAQFTIKANDLPNPVPESWSTKELADGAIEVTITGDTEIKVESFREIGAQAAGQLPEGFDPADHYNSRNHPRGLQMSVAGASDAINSLGVPWQTICDAVDPDEIAIYSTSALGQLDDYGFGGLLQSRLKSKRPTSKQIAFCFTSMPGDFINAYLCGNVGNTGSMAGACASLLYNLRLAVDDITSGKRRVVIVGSSEAPVTPEVIDGFSAMGALANNEKLKRLDNSDTVDFTRTSRPFGDNCGFTLGESSQYFILMDDALALELGAEIYGAVNDVFVNADGYKKSISAPGAGNYITLSKAVASARAIVGDESIKNKSLLHAHGSSTPQNRVTESAIFDKVAKAFDIKDWPVTAVKAFLGHPLAAASGDQLGNALGIFHDKIIPGITTTKEVAGDVLTENIDVCLQSKKADLDVIFLNSKGFGGNNATASVLSPSVVHNMLLQRYGKEKLAKYEALNMGVKTKANEYDEQSKRGEFNFIYSFGEGIISDENIEITKTDIKLSSFNKRIKLDIENPYSDMV